MVAGNHRRLRASLLDTKNGSMRVLWQHLYGDLSGIVALFAGDRTEPGSGKLTNHRSAYFWYPEEIDGAEQFCLRHCSEEREVYFGAHLLIRRRRIKANAAPLSALYADGDGAKVGNGIPEPTAVVQSSPGREQYFWGLASPVPP